MTNRDGGDECDGQHHATPEPFHLPASLREQIHQAATSVGEAANGFAEAAYSAGVQDGLRIGHQQGYAEGRREQQRIIAALGKQLAYS